MTPTEILATCRAAQKKVGKDNTEVVFRVRGVWKDRIINKRLWRGGPLARIVADADQDGFVIVMVAANVVIAALAEKGFS